MVAEEGEDASRMQAERLIRREGSVRSKGMMEGGE
jgi:hypothetical protein